MRIVNDLCCRGSIEKARRDPPCKRKEGEEKEKALIEWGIMRQTGRQMLACLYNGSARSFTRIPVTLKESSIVKFGSQPRSTCCGFCLTGTGQNINGNPLLEFMAQARDAPLSSRWRRSGPVWGCKVVLPPKMQMLLSSCVCSLLVHLFIMPSKPNQLCAFIFKRCEQ